MHDSLSACTRNAESTGGSHEEDDETYQNYLKEYVLVNVEELPAVAIEDHVAHFEVTSNLVIYISRYLHIIIDLDPKSDHRGIHIMNIWGPEQHTLHLESSALRLENETIPLDEEIRTQMVNYIVEWAGIIAKQDPVSRRKMLTSSVEGYTTENNDIAFSSKLPESDLELSWVMSSPDSKVSSVPSFAVLFGGEISLILFPRLRMFGPVNIGNLLSMEKQVKFWHWFEDVKSESLYWIGYFRQVAQAG